MNRSMVVKTLKIVVAALVLLAAIVAVAAPIGPLPGFFIGGNTAAPPASWPDTSDVHEIRLKVPRTVPRVVIIWVVEHEGDLHVVGSPDSGWVTMLGDGGPVEMRLGDNTYALYASQVTDGWEPVLTAWLDKYRPDYPDIVAGFPSNVEEASGQFALFRLDRG